MRTLSAAVLTLASVLCGTQVSAQVTVREEALRIPTWEIGPPEVHPLWPGPRGEAIYPYTLNETLTDRKVDRTYRAIFLENEYVQVLVLPEIGGRVHGARDKTNGYTWLYWQPTIKPGLISMTGAWISGGIEWNFPHGHRPSGFMPVDHRVVRQEDGSATVWVGETEPIYRMRWLVGITVFPGRSYFRCEYVFINPTGYSHPFQFWATSATHANEWSQAQYPGDVVTGHGKQEFWNWPIHDRVDLTWWKNVKNASSFFAWNNPSDWFGTYDHRAQSGMAHVADHRVMPGKKLWTWGSGPSGRIWEDILTEGGGAYFEPQAGAWSDNQPDYHWMTPNQVRVATDYWFPVRDTRGFHNANEDFAVNTDLQKGLAFGGVYATGVFPGAKVVLKDARSHSVLKDATVDLSPDRPWTVEVPAGPGLSVYDLRLTVHDREGRLRIELQQSPPKKVDLPAPAKQPGDPARMTQDELAFWGEWLDRFRRGEEAEACYREALRRDPADPRANLEMGFRALKATRWEEALRHLDVALPRTQDSGRLAYGKGLAHLGLARYDEAYDAFARAARFTELLPAASLHLARLDVRRGEHRRALERAGDAAFRNGRFADIPALEAAIHRLMGSSEQALAAAERSLALDPMHFMAGREKSLALAKLGRPAEPWQATFDGYMRGAVQNFIELAAIYVEAGLHADADAVLDGFSKTQGAAPLNPMVHYLRGLCREAMGDTAGATELFRRGEGGPLAYSNPSRVEELAALEAALKVNPRDASAHHLLGNLLYGVGRREDALGHWKEATRLNPLLALSWRNVGYGERNLRQDDRAALDAYRKALEIDPSDARVLLEMDQVAERLKVAPAERLLSLEKLRATVERRDDLVLRWVDLRLADGAQAGLEAAHGAMTARDFHVWEGGYTLHLVWTDLNRTLGDLALERKDLRTALAYYEQAAQYPKNLKVAPRTPDFRAHVNWSFAGAHLALGQRSDAAPYLLRILDERHPKAGMGTYYQALAQKANGNTAAHDKLIAELETAARARTSADSTKAIGLYLLSLALDEKGERDGAAQARQQALERDPRAARRALTQAQVEFAGAHQ
jgi:tetratricopeptide (TPR) repeat protein